MGKLVRKLKQGRGAAVFDANREMGDDEIGQLLEELKEEGPSPAALAEQARGEVERILSATDERFVLGGGTPFEREREFQRLLKLLHPDAGHVSGKRPALALRRITDAHRKMKAEIESEGKEEFASCHLSMT